MMTGNKKELKQKIVDYFTESFIKIHKENKRNVLRPLDNKYREYYTGVTLNYIVYDLLKAKYKKKDVVTVLKELYSDARIKMLKCPDINKMVFEKLTGPYGGTCNGYGSRDHYNYLDSFLIKT